jgi:DNA-binding FadR family transcriptional regulator
VVAIVDLQIETPSQFCFDGRRETPAEEGFSRPMLAHAHCLHCWFFDQRDALFASYYKLVLQLCQAYYDINADTIDPGVMMHTDKKPRTGGKAVYEPTLADQVTRHLADQLRSGVYPVNSRLPTEKAIAEEFGVSRTVVREAISRLKSEGLVATRQGSGTAVLEPNASAAFRLSRVTAKPAEGVMRIIELRSGIEAQMAALAAQRRNASEMAEIKRALKAIDRAVTAGGDGVKEDLEFHMAISRATKNPNYTDLLGMLTRALHDAIRVTRGNEARRADLTDAVRAEHEAICAAILARDPDAARAAALGHMESTVLRIEHAEAGFWTGERREAARRLAGSDLKAVLAGQSKMPIS